MSGKRSKKGSRSLLVAASVALVIVVLGAAGVATAVGAEAEVTDSIPAGVQIGGVDLAGLDEESALERLRTEFEAPLDEPIQVLVDGEETEAGTVTRRQLGATTNVEQLLAQALSGAQELSKFERFWQRLTGNAPERSFEVRTAMEEDGAEGFISTLADETYEPATDASVTASADSVRVVPGKPGFELDREKALQILGAAATDLSVRVVDLPGNEIEPDRTAADFDDVIVVLVGENKLKHFQNGALVKTYDVATGLPSYPTPIGEFEIVLKRYRPTWVNPAKQPGRWGENLPASIGPGPDNPLGTRAMNLNAPNIRIHGTSADWTLGYNASHGCIRMRMSDVEELFDRVEEGTKVVIVRSGADRLAPKRPAEPTVEDLVESAGAAPVQPEQSPPDPAPEPPEADAAPPQEPQPVPSPSPAGDEKPDKVDEIKARLGMNDD